MPNSALIRLDEKGGFKMYFGFSHPVFPNWWNLSLLGVAERPDRKKSVIAANWKWERKRRRKNRNKRESEKYSNLSFPQKEKKHFTSHFLFFFLLVKRRGVNALWLHGLRKKTLNNFLRMAEDDGKIHTFRLHKLRDVPFFAALYTGYRMY